MGDWRHRYVVYRVDYFLLQGGRDKSSRTFITIKEVFDHSETAEKEVKRLNILGKSKDCEYYWQSAKYYSEPREIEVPVEEPSVKEERPGKSKESTEVEKCTPRFSVSLRIIGRGLQPDVISQRLGVSATRTKELSDGGVNWMFKSAPEQVSFEKQITDLFNRISDDFGMWQKLTEEYQVDIFIGVFADHPFLGWEMSSELIRQLAERNLRVGFDIYAGLES
jgi:hypothetical protein